jgi:hypothetical protein
MKKTVNWTISDFVVRLFLTCECAFFKKKARSVNFQYQCNRKARPAIWAEDNVGQLSDVRSGYDNAS